MIVELESLLLLELPSKYDSAYALIPVNCGSWYPGIGQGGMYVDVVVQTRLPLWSVTAGTTMILTLENS